MDGDCRVKMDVAAPTEPQEGHKSVLKTLAAGPTPWKCVAVALCVATVLCITLQFKEQGHTVKDDGLPIKLRAISKNARAAIHLEGAYNRKLNTVEWKTGVDQYHSEGELMLLDNEIVIPQGGLYFVYSQASFGISCKADDKDLSGRRELVHLNYMVKRWSDSYSSSRLPEDYHTILHSVRTACEKTPASDEVRDQGKWFNAVYMGAVFRLEAGDRLQTEMNKKFLPNVTSSPGDTFFGVFAL